MIPWNPRYPCPSPSVEQVLPAPRRIFTRNSRWYPIYASLLDQVNQLQRELGNAEGKIEALQTVQQKQQEQHQQPQTGSRWARMFGAGK